MTLVMTDTPLTGIVDTDSLPDMAPVAANPDGLHCQVCGVEIFRKPGARGRPPTKCDAHKKASSSTGRGSSSGMRQSHVRKAEQAADVLCQINAWAGAGLMIAQLPGTASEFAGREEVFRGQALNALLLDEKLCDMILRGGQKSGAAALLMAYTMMLGSVVPMAIMEIRERRESDDEQ